MVIKKFEGFNALRFFAAFLVVLHHAEQIRMTNGLANFKQYSLFNNGGLAVEFFFVLSGFLISYLLMRENEKTGNVSIKNFYMRRALRIWPLYYLMVFLGLLIVPFFLNLIGNDYRLPFDSTTGWLLYVFFLPNAVSSLYPPTGNLIYPLWSIGVEEQFYILWAPLIRFFFRHALWIFVAIIAIKIMLNELFFSLSQNNESYIFWMKFVRSIKFESMAIGGLGALYVFQNWVKKINSGILFRTPFQLICFFILAVHFCFRNNIYALDNFFANLYESFFTSRLTFLITSVFFLWLLINTALNESAILKFRDKWLNYLGEVSYGIYMYHIIVIYLVITVGKNILIQSSLVVSELLFYGAMLPILFLVSFVSYYYFEKVFLKIKKQYT